MWFVLGLFWRVMRWTPSLVPDGERYFILLIACLTIADCQRGAFDVGGGNDAWRVIDAQGCSGSSSPCIRVDDC